MMPKGRYIAVCALAFAAALPAMAQLKLGSSNQPIEISSDQLDVHQEDHKAIFTGNVIAVQGTSTMRSKVMTVFYTDSQSKPATTATAPAAKKDDSGGQSIQRIEATQDVVFTTPEEVAQGEVGVYDVASDTITLTGADVTLTKDKNVLKGTKLVYNMGTGRSVLTGGGTVTTGGKGKRVHGLFVPGDKK